MANACELQSQCWWVFPVLQEGCLPPLRPPSWPDRSKVSSSTTRPRGLQCRMPPACTHLHRHCPAGCPRPASPPRPCHPRCSTRRSRRWGSRRRSCTWPRRPSSPTPQALCPLLASSLCPRRALSRPCSPPYPGRRRCRPLRRRPSRRYSDRRLCGVEGTGQV